MATILITGANRGIGFAMARVAAARGDTVIATARNPAEAGALNALATETGRVTVPGSHRPAGAQCRGAQQLWRIARYGP